MLSSTFRSMPEGWTFFFFCQLELEHIHLGYESRRGNVEMWNGEAKLCGSSEPCEVDTRQSTNRGGN